jgi:hypothetical protein
VRLSPRPNVLPDANRQAAVTAKHGSPGSRGRIQGRNVTQIIVSGLIKTRDKPMAEREKQIRKKIAEIKRHLRNTPPPEWGYDELIVHTPGACMN